MTYEEFVEEANKIAKTSTLGMKVNTERYSNDPDSPFYNTVWPAVWQMSNSIRGNDTFEHALDFYREEVERIKYKETEEYLENKLKRVKAHNA